MSRIQRFRVIIVANKIDKIVMTRALLGAALYYSIEYYIY